MKTFRTLALTSALALTVAAGSAHAQVPPAAAAAAPANLSEAFATLRDGVKLAANVYKPAGKGPGRQWSRAPPT